MKPILIALVCAALCGCGSEKTQPQAEQNTGRPDTKAIEAARMVGYDGKQMRKAVDKALDGTEQRNKELENVLKQ
jgi:Holliday junction resolvasome RuvABC DNA-binding subunit